jgi:hypothetical protein
VEHLSDSSRPDSSRPNCSRVDCSEPAVAVVAFEARECLVWLDPIATPGYGAAVLCQLHADRLSPPRGWNLLDRRADESRLWTGRAAVPTAWMTARPARRERPVRVRSCAPTGPPLPFADAAAPEPTPAPAPSPASAPLDDHDLERILDARTPLLARAFDAARQPRRD